MRERGTRSDGAGSGASWEHAVGVGGSASVDAVQGHVTADASGTGNGSDVAEGEEGVTNAVGKILDPAHTCDTADLCSGTNGTEASSAISTGKIERVGAAEARACAGREVDALLLRVRWGCEGRGEKDPEDIEFSGIHRSRERLAQDHT